MDVGVLMLVVVMVVVRMGGGILWATWVWARDVEMLVLQGAAGDAGGVGWGVGGGCGGTGGQL